MSPTWSDYAVEHTHLMCNECIRASAHVLAAS